MRRRLWGEYTQGLCRTVDILWTNHASTVEGSDEELYAGLWNGFSMTRLPAPTSAVQ